MVRTARLRESSTSTVTRDGLRRRNEIAAVLVGHTHRGPNTLSTRVPAIGDGSTLSRSV